MLFSPVGSSRLLTFKIVNEIEKAIRIKKLKPGDKLPSEQELCKQFMVSRTVIREALKMLSSKGLVRIERGRGVFVEKISSDIVTAPFEFFLEVKYEKNYAIDVVRARQIIEPSIAYYAALNRTNEDIKYLSDNIEKFRESGNQAQKLVELDMDFHLGIVKAVHNSIIYIILEPVYKVFMPKLNFDVYQHVRGAKDSALRLHSEILNAISKGDPLSASELMKKHLMIAEKHVNKIK